MPRLTHALASSGSSCPPARAHSRRGTAPRNGPGEIASPERSRIVPVDTPAAASELRAARARLGISRAQLASLAGCSLAALGAIEQGAVPRRSAVLERARQAIQDAERAAEAGERG